MTGWELLKTGWDWKPSVLAGCAAVLAGYGLAVRFRVNRKTILFTLGVLGVFLVLVSPIDTLGDDYLFSAHMTQHLVLDMAAPALFVLGTPAWAVTWLLKHPFFASMERILGNPALCLILGNFTLCLWHLPVLFNATLENERLHVFQHLTFLVTGTMLWWPVFKPIRRGRLPPLQSMAYLSISAFINGILGIILTIPSTSFYSAYAHPRDGLGALSLIRDQWKLDPVADQQLGGAIMWVFGSGIYIWAVLAMVARWQKSTESSVYGIQH